MKIKDLIGVMPASDLIIINSTDADGFVDECLYKGHIECIDDKLKDLNVLKMFSQYSTCHSWLEVCI